MLARPEVLGAVNPLRGVVFLRDHGVAGLFALGAVFLAVTGAEALYADLGHFGRGPIRVAWLAVVFPALAVNYLGQGGLVLASPAALENPFFLLYPEWALIPMVALATIATVIASQAVITGAFSITQQAVQLGLLPRIRSAGHVRKGAGPDLHAAVNRMLLLAVLFLVQAFGSSSALAAAYGIAVTGTMVVDGAARLRRGLARLELVTLGRGCVDAAVPRHRSGFPRSERLEVARRRLAAFAGRPRADGGDDDLASRSQLAARADPPGRGAAGELRRLHRAQLGSAGVGHGRVPHQHPESAPTALLHKLKHNRVLHERNLILSIETADTPRVEPATRATITPISASFTLVRLVFGYMEEPNVAQALADCRRLGLPFDVMSTSFYLSRRKLKPSMRSRMPRWQDRLFIALAGGASDAAAYFGLPTSRVVEVGTQIVI